MNKQMRKEKRAAVVPNETSDLAKDMSPRGKEEDAQHVKVFDSDFLQEPAGIGLAWTILNRFFAGSNLVMGNLDGTSMPSKVQKYLVLASDASMKTVILYLLRLKRKGHRPDIGADVIL